MHHDHDNHNAAMKEAKLPARRRARRPAEETREDILAMAERLFREKGLSAVAIVDIAAALAMSPANIFKHFHSKTALIDAIAARHLEALAAREIYIDDTISPPQRLLCLAEHLMHAHLRDVRENPYIFEMVLVTTDRNTQCRRRYWSILTEHIEAILRDGVDTGFYNITDTAHSASVAAMALICVLHPVMLANEDPDILATRCRDVVSMVNCALQNPLEK